MRSIGRTAFGYHGGTQPKGKTMTASNRPTTARRPVQYAAATVGVVFLLVGILGFVPGITANYDQLGAAGHSSMEQFLGVIQDSALHNILDLRCGARGLAMARTAASAKNYLIWGGVIYAVLWI